MPPGFGPGPMAVINECPAPHCLGALVLRDDTPSDGAPLDGAPLDGASLGVALPSWVPRVLPVPSRVLAADAASSTALSSGQRRTVSIEAERTGLVTSVPPPARPPSACCQAPCSSSSDPSDPSDDVAKLSRMWSRSRACCKRSANVSASIASSPRCIENRSSPSSAPLPSRWRIPLPAAWPSESAARLDGAEYHGLGSAHSPAPALCAIGWLIVWLLSSLFNHH